jgi:hypothetical protein
MTKEYPVMVMDTNAVMKFEGLVPSKTNAG